MPDKPKKIMNDMVAGAAKKTPVSLRPKQPTVKKSEPPIQIQKKPIPQIEPVADIEYSLDEYTGAESYHPRELRQPSRWPLGIVIIASVAAIMLAVGGLFAHATIRMTPKIFSGPIDATVTLSSDTESSMPFFATATKTFTTEKIVAATGRTTVESKATGKVRFYNTGTVAKRIPASTVIVATDGHQYQITKPITIPAKKGVTPGSIEAVIVAIKAGAEYNQELDDFSFANPKGFETVTVRSTTAITGGAGNQDTTADPAAIAIAVDEVRVQLDDTTVLMRRMQSELPNSMIMLPLVAPGTSVSVKTLSNYPDGVHVVGSKTVTIALANRFELARAMGDQLKVSPDINLTMDSLDGLAVVAQNPTLVQNQERLQVRITGNALLYGFVDPDAVIQHVAGISRHDAKEWLRSLSEADSFSISMVPPWRRVFPGMAKDIAVSISSPK